MRRQTHLFALAATAIAVACGGGNGGSTGNPDRVFTSVAVTPPTATVAVHSTQQLTATPRDQNNNPMGGLPAAVFTSNNQSRATVSASGLVTGVSAGDARITASVTHGGVTGSGFSDVTVTGGGAPSTATVQTGGGTTFSPASVTIAQNGTVTWEWSGVEHNVTFTTAGAPANIATRSTGTESRTFPTLGTFDYNCTLHAGMNGEVRVVTP